LSKLKFYEILEMISNALKVKIKNQKVIDCMKQMFDNSNHKILLSIIKKILNLLAGVHGKQHVLEIK